MTLTFMLGGCLLPSVPVDGSDDDPGAQDATDDDTDEPGDTNDNSDAADSNDTGQAFTCDDLAADYAALMAINECIFDEDCHVVRNHCEVGLGDCWGAVDPTVTQSELDAIAGGYEGCDDAEPCACSDTPPSAICSDGTCAIAMDCETIADQGACSALEHCVWSPALLAERTGDSCAAEQVGTCLPINNNPSDPGCGGVAGCDLGPGDLPRQPHYRVEPGGKVLLIDLCTNNYTKTFALCNSGLAAEADPGECACGCEIPI
ncbi:MAG TPA: hypothetical protein VK034_03265 [Enhygromyxa sp.]|nr:hypothetical protein [Enhygromyxa sp.]